MVNNKYLGFSGSTLKIIGMIAMFIDHFAASILYYGVLPPFTPDSDISFLQSPTMYTFYVIYQIMRIIGRIALPIFCFLLVEGFYYSSNRKKYMMRLFLFGILSEYPFDLAIFHKPLDWSHQNIYFTLLIGFAVIWFLDLLQQKSKSICNHFLQLFVILSGCGLAYLLRTDYDYNGIILIVILYLFRYDRKLSTLLGCTSLYWNLPAMLAFIPLYYYNSQRGLNLKYFFYAFYPLHLLLFGIILSFMA